jgi:hypothetical protein
MIDSLNSIIKQSSQDGKIDEVVVLSWTDEEYPSKNKKELSKLFNTNDTTLKELMVSAGLSTTGDGSDYVNKASRSVILIKVK